MNYSRNYSKSHRKLTTACQTKANRKKTEGLDYWHTIYDWIQKSVSFKQFCKEKTAWIKNKIKTDTDQI